MTAFSSSLPIDIFGGAAAAAAVTDVPDHGTAESGLIVRSQQGCHHAFRALVEQHQGLVHRISLRWLECPEDAAEVCQDTFLRAWQALPAWQPRGKFRTWLCQIALNLCRDRARSRTRRQSRATVPLAALPLSPVCPQPAPDVSAIHAGDMDKLRIGLARLPPALRGVLILCGMEGLSHLEAAAILQCSPRAVEGRLYRARRALLKWWNGEDS